MREKALRLAAIDAGVVPLKSIIVPVDMDKAAIGEKLFQSTTLSLNSDTSCQTCHLDEFSSADGLPNAIGTGGHGEGPERMGTGGDIVPRNTLPLWGRGTKGFETFFWDGKVEATPNGIVSQFGDDVPSDDPLIVAVHLPFVEIREMVVRDETIVETYEKEETEPANAIFDILAVRVRKDPVLAPGLSKAFGVSEDEIEFIHIAEAVAAFIRDNFKVETTKFDRFVFGDEMLSEQEVRGGLIFYGKGQCSSCHTGPLFSDLKFHVMPFEQSGFGKNGFGVDYGRYNATLNPDDTYFFRTPPLINVSQTAPYSHSGAYTTLEAIVRAHIDPLVGFDPESMNERQRREYLQRLAKWSNERQIAEPLAQEEVLSLVAFLKTLDSDDQNSKQ